MFGCSWSSNISPSLGKPLSDSLSPKIDPSVRPPNFLQPQAPLHFPLADLSRRHLTPVSPDDALATFGAEGQPS
jgi:hypothetical protein